ncbi:MAG: hypothetical protein QW265_01980 [Candidatus Bathyarchaeia archaeon]
MSMKIKTADEIMKEVMKKYNKDPKEWKVFAGKDRAGYYDLVITHKSQIWLIKSEQINPFKWVGYGVKQSVESEEKIDKFSPFQFGFRPLSKRKIEELLENLNGPEKTNEFVLKLLNTQPKPIHEIKSPLVVQGPIVYSSKPLEIISEEQRRLDNKLKNELEKLIYKKYSQTRTLYI